MKSGIDLSSWNGRGIDFEKVKNNGIDFCILRTGFGSDCDNQIDNCFYEYYDGCLNAGIPVGVYHYGYATTSAEAIGEADFCLRILSGRDAPYCVWYDIEESCMLDAGRERLTEIANAFCQRISEHGYKAGVYMSVSPAENAINMNEVPYFKWIAQYNNQLQYSGYADIWQYTSTGLIPGISTNVDCNYCYTKFTSEDPYLSPYEWVFYKDHKKWALKQNGEWVYDKWVNIDGIWYRIDTDGWVLCRQWYQEGANWYYFDEHCHMVTGWNFIDNEWYYMDNDGNMLRSIWIDGKYYLKDSGIMERNGTLTFTFDDSGNSRLV